jgi:hypothetical protein
LFFSHLPVPLPVHPFHFSFASFDIAAGMKVTLDVEVTTGTLGEINDTLEVQSEYERFSIPVTAKVVAQGENKGRLAKGVDKLAT